MADNERIAKLEEKIRVIQARQTYASTPAWHQEVAELRVQIEELRSGKAAVLRPYENPELIRLAAPAGAAAAVASAHDHHADDDHHEPNYMKIFLWLTICTLIELAMSPLKIRGWALAFGLTGFASLKALMVAFYYMHLSAESKAFRLLLILPIILISIMFLLVLPDALHLRLIEER